jgi:hypothetical protein
MNDQSTTIPSTTPTASAPTTSPARPVATRTKLLLEGPIFATLVAACGAEHSQLGRVC